MYVFIFYSVIGIALLIYYAATLYKSYKSVSLQRIKNSELRASSPLIEKTKVSIIIPVRNEEATIETCIKSILASQYQADFYQVIVVDDHSTDSTAEIVKKIKSVKYILNDGAGKKQAIAHAIAVAEHDLVLCTDGDTLVGNQWIWHHVLSSRDHSFSTGIVKYNADKTTLGALQIHDNSATMCLTAYGINNHRWHVANGANMSFAKSFYTSTGGHLENQHIPSGDDVFLVKKAQELNAAIGFIDDLDAAVSTQAESTWRSFWQQRQRWSSKTMIVNDTNLVFFQGVTFIISLFIVVGLMLGWMISPSFILGVVVLFIIKLIVDFLFLSSVHRWLGYSGFFNGFVWVSFVYLCYVVLIGVYALFPKRYTWKGRDVLS